MKTIIALVLIAGTAFGAANTKVISKITDVYQLRSGHAQLLESEYEVGTFNEIDGMATDIQTLNEKQKDKQSTVDKKLAKVIEISGVQNETMSSKKISSEVCTTNGNRKYCSTSIELVF